MTLDRAVHSSAPTGATSPRYRTLVYGSCVARDSFEFLDPARFTLSSYVARQSLISAAHPADPTLLDAADLDSRFQRRMLDGDARSTLWSVLQSNADSTDLLMCDLTDERLGVYRFPDGSCLTRSVELIRSGLEDEIASRSMWLRFGSDEHFGLWLDSLHTLRDRLVTLGLHDRTLFLLVPWATTDVSGEPVAGSFGTEAHDANRAYDRYNAAVAGLFPGQTVTVDEAGVQADAAHQWGAAPFHYSRDTYQAVVAQVLAWLEQRQPAPSAPKAPHPASTEPGDGPTLRQVAPGSLVIESRAPAGVRLAFHLYRGQKRVQEIPYGDSRTATFDGLAAGSYRCRVYMSDPTTGARTAVTTDRVTVESLSAGPPVRTPPQTEVAVVGLHSTAAMLGLVLATHHRMVGLVAPDAYSPTDLCGLPVVVRSAVPASATLVDPADPAPDDSGLPAWQQLLDRELSRLTAMQMYRIARRLYLAGAEREAKLLKVRIYREYGCVLPYTAQIGDGTRLGYGGIATVVHSRAVIGSDVVIGQNVTIGAKAHVPHIGDRVFIGTGTVCLAAEVGDDAVIGANSIVLDSVPAGAVVAGNPARVISSRHVGGRER